MPKLHENRQQHLISDDQQDRRGERLQISELSCGNQEAEEEGKSGLEKQDHDLFQFQKVERQSSAKTLGSSKQKEDQKAVKSNEEEQLSVSGDGQQSLNSSFGNYSFHKK